MRWDLLYPRLRDIPLRELLIWPEGTICWDDEPFGMYFGYCGA